jgi:hypothetical protein
MRRDGPYPIENLFPRLDKFGLDFAYTSDIAHPGVKNTTRSADEYSLTKKAGRMEQTAQELSSHAIEPDAPDMLKQMAKDHWAKYRPKMYQRLLTTGVLDDLLERAVEFTREDMRHLEKQLRQQGYTEGEAREQAWQELRAKWILLPREK